MKKVLLMGPSKSGKTSMRSMIFANFTPRDTSRLALTIELENVSARILGNLVLSLWDCGGQFDIIKMYKTTQRANFFSNVAILIYILDTSALRGTYEDDGTESPLANFNGCIEALKQYSPDAKVFCLMHKMDKFELCDRESVFQAQKSEVEKHAQGTDVEFFPTSIWDSTLYSAWNAIVGSQIPGIDIVKKNVEAIARACELSVAAVYDRSTLLCICYYDFTNENRDPVVKTSIFVKAFKLAASRQRYALVSMEIEGPGYTALIQEFTPNTLLLAVSRQKCVTSALLKMNVHAATSAFLKFLDRPEMNETKMMLC